MSTLKRLPPHCADDRVIRPSAILKVAPGSAVISVCPERRLKTKSASKRPGRGLVKESEQAGPGGDVHGQAPRPMPPAGRARTSVTPSPLTPNVLTSTPTAPRGRDLPHPNGDMPGKAGAWPPAAPSTDALAALSDAPPHSAPANVAARLLIVRYKTTIVTSATQNLTLFLLPGNNVVLGSRRDTLPVGSLFSSSLTGGRSPPGPRSSPRGPSARAKPGTAATVNSDISDPPTATIARGGPLRKPRGHSGPPPCATPVLDQATGVRGARDVIRCRSCCATGDHGPRCGVDGEPEHVGTVVVADRVEQPPRRAAPW